MSVHYHTIQLSKASPPLPPPQAVGVEVANPQAVRVEVASHQTVRVEVANPQAVGVEVASHQTVRVDGGIQPSTANRQALVLAIGNMDGVHLGHVTLLKEARKIADIRGCHAAVLTFEPHPRIYFNPGAAPLNLLPVSAKIALLRAHGMDKIIIAKFNSALAGMSAEAFITELCVRELGATHVVTGANFHFGKGRLGNAELMAHTMQKLGLGYSCVDPVNCNTGEAVSSTRIRNLLKQGDVSEASKLLGRSYTISGRVIHGDKRGSQIGFPTANIRVSHLFLPAYGVYATEALIDGAWRESVANIGMRPTFEKSKPLLEVHVFDWNKSLYGKRIEVRFKHYIRPEQKFTSPQSMIDQLKRDVVEARLVFGC